MIRIYWNLPGDLEYKANDPIDLVLTISNPSAEVEKCVIVLMLLDNNGYLLVDPATGKPYYYGVITQDSTFITSELQATLFTLQPSEEISVSSTMGISITDCILAVVALDESQQNVLDGLFCHLFTVPAPQPPSLQEMATRIAAGFMVAAAVGLVTGEIISC